jgi:hypothetical protein
MMSDKNTNNISNKKNSIGLKELQGKYYHYGVPNQAAAYTKTTNAIAEYAGLHISKEMWLLVDKLEETGFPEPDEPATTTPSQAQLEKYKMLLKHQLDKEEQYKSEKAKVFRIIISQCQPGMKHKVEALTDYKILEKNDDVVGLLKRMRELVYSTTGQQYEYWTMQSTIRTLVNMKQHPNESVNGFSKKFIQQLEMTEQAWGGPWIPAKLKQDANDQDKKIARDKFTACLFLGAVDRSKYKKVLDDLNNEYLNDHDNYPKDVPEVVSLLTNRRGGGNRSKQLDDMDDGVTTSFNQVKGNGKGKGKGSKCKHCGKKGHWAKICPQLNKQNDSGSESDASRASSKSTKTSKKRKPGKSYDAKFTWHGAQLPRQRICDSDSD